MQLFICKRGDEYLVSTGDDEFFNPPEMALFDRRPLVWTAQHCMVKACFQPWLSQGAEVVRINNIEQAGEMGLLFWQARQDAERCGCGNDPLD